MKHNIITLLIILLCDVIVVHVLALSECTTTDGSSANSVPCTCGSETCDATTGLICYSTTGGGSCRPNDPGAYGYPRPTTGKCADVVGRTSIEDEEACNAAATSLGLSDTSAYAGSASYFPPGCFRNTITSLNFNTLIASTASCNSNSVGCICIAGPICTHTYGLKINRASCWCGESKCLQNNLLCNSATNMCSEPPVCLNKDGQNDVACVCGSSYCDPDEYCNRMLNICSLHDKCVVTNGTIATDATCACGSVDCAVGKYCRFRTEHWMSQWGQCSDSFEGQIC